MGIGYLLDTNTIIDYLNNKLPASGNIIETNAIQFSVISRIELLSWPLLNEDQLKIIESFASSATVWGLDENIIIKAAELRRGIKKVKLPDAIIAATAFVNGFTLITHNVADFKNIPGLKILDLHSL